MIPAYGAVKIRGKIAMSNEAGSGAACLAIAGSAKRLQIAFACSCRGMMSINMCF